MRAPSTPFLLRLAMAVAILPVAFFAAVMQLGVARNDSTVETVGSEATRGITAAQALKLNLAELDEIVVRNLLEAVPLEASGFPDAYNDKRAEVHDNLLIAAASTLEGDAYRQPLVNIEYALAHYHALVRDAFAAVEQGDAARATELYDDASEVMDETLLAEADFVDKANTYVLNDSYDRQKARSASTNRLMVASWIVLLAFLVAIQVLLLRRFRRLLNVALAAATLIAVAGGAYTLVQLGSSSSALTKAREDAFDEVHVLARARATMVSARAAEGHLILSLGNSDSMGDARSDFEANAQLLYRLEGQEPAGTEAVGPLARAGRVPDEASGYLPTVATTEREGPRGPAREAVRAFGTFLAADAGLRHLVDGGDIGPAIALYNSGQGFTEMAAAIDDAQTSGQATFDEHAAAAAAASDPVDEVTLVVAGAVLVLVLLGLFQRLREYGT